MCYADYIFINYFGRIKIITIFAPPKRKFGIGESVAQSVEHNTFNVGVPGSSPGGFTTKSGSYDYRNCLFCFYNPCFCYFCVNRGVNRVNQNERNNQGFMLQI